MTQPTCLHICVVISFIFSGQQFFDLTTSEDKGVTIQNHLSGTSQVVQRVRLAAPNEGGPGSVSGWGTGSRTPQLRPGAA